MKLPPLSISIAAEFTAVTKAMAGIHDHLQAAGEVLDISKPPTPAQYTAHLRAMADVFDAVAALQCKLASEARAVADKYGHGSDEVLAMHAFMTLVNLRVTAVTDIVHAVWEACDKAQKPEGN